MTRFEGRIGFGDAPTSAIVFALPRISAGVRLMGARLSSDTWPTVSASRASN